MKIFENILILVTHIILLVLMTIVSISAFINSNYVGFSTGLLSSICWLVLIFFFDIPKFLDEILKNKKETSEHEQSEY